MGYRFGRAVTKPASILTFSQRPDQRVLVALSYIACCGGCSFSTRHTAGRCSWRSLAKSSRMYHEPFGSVHERLSTRLLGPQNSLAHRCLAEGARSPCIFRAASACSSNRCQGSVTCDHTTSCGVNRLSGSALPAEDLQAADTPRHPCRPLALPPELFRRRVAACGHRPR